jgi:hypothetical protein
MSADLRSFRRAARTSLALIPLALTGATYGVGPSLAQAETVFTPIKLPTISGAAVEGEVLQLKPGTWSTPPASAVNQWQRCDRSGNKCSSIEHAKGQTYRLTNADVGFTIRVGESAKNASGAVTPAISEPTSVVQAGGKPGGKPGGGGSGGGSAPPVSCCGTPAHEGPPGIKSLLARQLVPSGKADSIPALLRHGGLSMSFTLPRAGTLVVQWYFPPRGTKLSGRGRAKPVLVAAGRATLTAAKGVRLEIKLTARGRQLLGHTRRIRLAAKGTFAPKGGAAVSAARAFTLKR